MLNSPRTGDHTSPGSVRDAAPAQLPPAPRPAAGTGRAREGGGPVTTLSSRPPPRKRADEALAEPAPGRVAPGGEVKLRPERGVSSAESLVASAERVTTPTGARVLTSGPAAQRPGPGKSAAQAKARTTALVAWAPGAVSVAPDDAAQTNASPAASAGRAASASPAARAGSSDAPRSEESVPSLSYSTAFPPLDGYNDHLLASVIPPAPSPLAATLANHIDEILAAVGNIGLDCVDWLRERSPWQRWGLISVAAMSLGLVAGFLSKSGGERIEGAPAVVAVHHTEKPALRPAAPPPVASAAPSVPAPALAEPATPPRPADAPASAAALVARDEASVTGEARPKRKATSAKAKRAKKRSLAARKAKARRAKATKPARPDWLR